MAVPSLIKSPCALVEVNGLVSSGRTGRLDPLVIDQNRETLNPEWSLADALTDGGGDSVIVADKPRNVIGYMKDFLFLP